MKRSKKPLWLFAAISVATFAFVSIDTRPYRVAMSALARPETLNSIETMKKDIEADAQRLWSCAGPEVTNSASEARARSCLIDALSKSQTTVGAVVGASKATAWLTTHPGDQEVRSAALIAIENGRKAMLASKEVNYDRFQNVAIAHDQSLILRLVEGNRDQRNVFVLDADQLDKHEYAVLMPEVQQKQNAWRDKVLPPQKP
jgi:hypothetical protein